MNNQQPAAIALKYDGKTAPVVTAKGSGDVAERILEIAYEYNIPYQENAELLSLLSTLELGEEIPRNLYVAVAEVIAFAYFISGKTPCNEVDTGV
ncbi:MAG: EscU/YscU/HrcU family type III secretion system export apparatus switch protein [Gammaproteobacteria bacterium]